MHGWLIIDKPIGIGSTQIVGAVKRARTGEPRPEFRSGHGYFGGITVPQRLHVRASKLP